MKNLSFKLILAFALLLSASVSIALPVCKGSYSAQWTGCIGTVTLEEGGEYVGEFVNGNFNGQGTLTWSNGDVYVGNWKNDYRDGQGKYTWSNGEVYVGNWKNGNHDGHGTKTWSDGDVYVGNWKNDYQDGQGKYTWSDGENYVGDFKDSLFTGQGIYTYADGTVEEGIFFEDEFLYESKTSSTKTTAAVQYSEITAVPSKEDILDALYGPKAVRKLVSIDIITMDGFFETKNIYAAQVKFRMKDKNLPDVLREMYIRDALIESGMTRDEASYTANLMSVLNGFSGIVGALGGGLDGGNVNEDNSRVITEILRFGKGNNGWIYLPEQASVSDSSDSYYETDFQGWVDKYATF